MPGSREPVSAGPICCDVGLGGGERNTSDRHKSTLPSRRQKVTELSLVDQQNMSELKGNFGFIGTEVLEMWALMFLGLGMMGYPMAANIRKKMPSSSTFYIFDVSKAALERFVSEHGSAGEIVIASSSKEVVDNAVCSVILRN